MRKNKYGKGVETVKGLRRYLPLLMGVLFIMVAVVGCGKGGSNNNNSQVNEGELNEAKQVVTDFFAAAETYDIKGANGFLSNNDRIFSEVTAENEKLVIQPVFAKISCEIQSAKKTEEDIMVEVEITSVDAEKLIAEYTRLSFWVVEEYGLDGVDRQFLDDVVREGLISFISDNINTITRTETAEIKLQMINEKWMIVKDQELVDAMLGRLEPLASALVNFNRMPIEGEKEG